jgi:hypothetical protein
MTNAQTAANPFCHAFTGRKPSKAQVLNKAKQFDKQGADFVALTWGENWIDLVLIDGYWHGSGWFKEIGGDWVARELNHCPRKALDQAFGNPVQFMRDHFTIIHVK